MSKKIFTEEEVILLAKNPYTYSVTVNQLHLRKEFKEIFFEEYSKGVTSREILEKYGFPASVLGEKRIYSIGSNIRFEYKNYGYFSEGSSHCKRANANGDYSEAEHLKKLEHEVEYLKQEVLFLKKIFASAMQRR